MRSCAPSTTACYQKRSQPDFQSDVGWRTYAEDGKAHHQGPHPASGFVTHSLGVMIMSNFLGRFFGHYSSDHLPIHGPLLASPHLPDEVNDLTKNAPDFVSTVPMSPEGTHYPDAVQSDFFRPGTKLRMLDKVLATQCIFMLRYRRHHCSATVLGSPWIAENFIRNSNQALRHSDKITRRIVQLGGLPDYSPQSLDRRSHVNYDESSNLQSIINSNLLAERSAMQFYNQMALLIGDQDWMTRHLIEQITVDADIHINELKSWLNQN